MGSRGDREKNGGGGAGGKRKTTAKGKGKRGSKTSAKQTTINERVFRRRARRDDTRSEQKRARETIFRTFDSADN